MDLLTLVIGVVVMGFVVWVMTTRVPLPPGWATVIQVGALVLVLLYVVTRFLRLPDVLP